MVVVDSFIDRQKRKSEQDQSTATSTIAGDQAGDTGFSILKCVYNPAVVAWRKSA